LIRRNRHLDIVHAGACARPAHPPKNISAHAAGASRPILSRNLRDEFMGWISARDRKLFPQPNGFDSSCGNTQSQFSRRNENRLDNKSRPTEKVVEADTDGFGNPHCRIHRNVFLPTLHSTDVHGGKLGLFGQTFLRQSCLFAKAADGFP